MGSRALAVGGSARMPSLKGSPSASFASSRIQFWRYENNFAPLLCSVRIHQHRLRLFELPFNAFFRFHFGPV